MVPDCFLTAGFTLSRTTAQKHTMRNVAFLVMAGLSWSVAAQDTFSIVAVDPDTRQVGSAGATCLDSVLEGTSAVIISSIKPGVGAIHTQSYWNPVNQANANARMDAGDSPEEIMDWLEANDAEGNPAIRQYGAADLDPANNPRVSAFTGDDCFDYKGHELGPNYAVQGNILSGRAILDSMSFRFFFEVSDLAGKLMASMQGAKKIGADTRCFAAGVSSRSAFLRVANPDDSTELYLDLVVGSTPPGVDPIDVLQEKFDAWRALNPYIPPTSGLFNPAASPAVLVVSPNPAGPQSRIAALSAQHLATGPLTLQLAGLNGQFLLEFPWDGREILLAELLRIAGSGAATEPTVSGNQGANSGVNARFSAAAQAGLPAGFYAVRALSGTTLVAQNTFIYQP
ncbi:MAG: DUF1028 domain-containing protein [Bacteroidetes bacterium]|nr:DUF1028 domain-containing protein [Bacteroidota bacterium]